ncbi:MAG: hypothetical protein IPP99_01450 [Chitinophagaceae bacterium]|nr:hypothetical protein [Chitinophagaceae bacterium]MBP6588461.1 hypothetical protein [Chitinophagaceae bacterium]
MEGTIKKLYKKGPLPDANWTIIIYLNGESDLLDDVKRNYNQIAKYGSDFGNVNFVVLFDGLKVPKVKARNGASCNLPPRIYYVSRFEEFKDDNYLQEFPKQEDLSKPGNLALIIRRIKKQFPAKKFGFIYNGHGGAGGPAVDDNPMMVKLTTRQLHETEEALIKRLKRKYEKEGWELSGTCTHVDNPEIILAVFIKEKSERFLTYQQMGTELSRSGFSQENGLLGFICLDCCWGQQFETAICFRNVTRYLIASPDEAALLGIGYEDFAEFLLQKHATIKYDELANNLVGIYFKNNYDDYLASEEFSYMGVSLSCVDMGPDSKELDQFGRIIRDAAYWKMDHLADYLFYNLERLWKVIWWARHKCVDYTYMDDPDFYGTYNIDLLWFLENLLHYNHLYGRRAQLIDTELHIRVSRLQTELSMRFVKSNLASNYKGLEVNSTMPQLGGKGIAITFPVTELQVDNSIYGNDLVFDGNKKWKRFVEKFAAYNTSNISRLNAEKHFRANKVSKWNFQKI